MTQHRTALKSGRYYNISHTSDVGRRRYDIAIQLPEPVSEEARHPHRRPRGIERYWRKTRFSQGPMSGVQRRR